MLIYGSTLSGVPIIGLSSGGQIATTKKPVIDSTSLKIVGLMVEVGKDTSMILMSQDIREYNAELILVNSEDDLIAADEIIRLRPVIEQDFRVTGAQVKNESEQSLGSVSEYTFDPKTFIIQQLYVKPPLIKSLMNHNLVIARQQIIEVAPPVIIVRDASLKEPAAAGQPATLE